MDRTPGTHNDHFAGNNVFADNQQFNAYDSLNLYPHPAESNFNDAGWGVNPSEYPNPSRAPQPASTWLHNANHLAAQITQQGYSGSPSPYARSSNASPVPPYNNNLYTNYGASQNFAYREQKYDPALVQGNVNAQHPTFNLGRYGQQPSNAAATIAPQALEHARSPAGYGNNPYSSTQFQNSSNNSNNSNSNNSNHNSNHNNNSSLPKQDAPPPAVAAAAASPLRIADEEALANAIPQSQSAGIFGIVRFDDLANATNTQRLGNFVNISKERQEWRCNRSALPAYAPRHSRKELRELAGKNVAALARIGKRISKEKSRAAAPKPVTSAAVLGVPVSSLPVKAPETSSEEESSDEDDDSEYSDDEPEESPLPSRKPEDLRGSIRYDTIKALWRSQRKEVESASLKKALVDFWEIVKTIRDRWKADSAALTDAEEKKRAGELPLLKSRVKDQRDMMEVAFRTAFEHGHRGIVELLAENESLLFVCYQFLLDRYKAEDLNSPVALAILETMSTFTTLTASRSEKTRVGKILSIYAKKGNAKTQYWAKKITTNSAAASKSAATKDGVSQKVVPPATKAQTSVGSNHDAPSPPAKRTVESVTGVKRAASSAGDTNPVKKAATASAKANGLNPAAKANGAVKKPMASAPAPSAAATNAATVARKTVAAKPSGFFSSLNSAAKKPGTSIADKPSATGADKSSVKSAAATTTAAPKPAFSFAETMAKLSKPKEEKPAPKVEKEIPNETPEERRKRLRKEERRKLSVRFATDDDLVQIRYFTHDPEEEIHHDASQTRDVSDVGGEGRMFKQQHQKMDVDDDEEEAAEAEEILVEFRPPPLVDFSVVDHEERERNYAPYGGGKLQPVSPERVERERYEDSHLVEIYTDPGQIPDDPREPANPHTGDSDEPPRAFGAPDEQYLARARARAGARHPTPATLPFDPSTLAGLMNRPQPPPPPTMAPPSAPAAPVVPDIQKILATLQGAGAYQAPAQSAPAYSSPFAPSNNAFPSQAPAAPPPAGGIDLQAILWSLQANHAQNHGSGSAAPHTAPAGFDPNGVPQQRSSDDGTKQANGSHPFYKTKACRFWQEGRCQKGDGCTYLHEDP